MAKTNAEKLGITEDEYKILLSAIRRTWNYIAYDIFQCAESDRIPREEAIEVTLDAGRVVTQNRDLPDNLKKLLNSYDSKWYDTLEAALKQDVFKSKYEYC